MAEDSSGRHCILDHADDLPVPLPMESSAQDSKPRPAGDASGGKPEARPITSLEDIKNCWIEHLPAGRYTYNFENPDSGINRRGFSTRRPTPSSWTWPRSNSPRTRRRAVWGSS